MATERKLTMDEVPKNLARIYDGELVTAVWETDTDGILIFGSHGLVTLETWDAWKQDFWTARQDLKANKRTEYSNKECYHYSAYAFQAARADLNAAALEAERYKESEFERRSAAPAPRHQEYTGEKRDGVAVAPLNPDVLTLRPYQERAVKQITDAVKRGKRRILLVGPTGMGKMVLAAYLMKKTSQRGNPSLFLADIRELIGQCRDKLNQYGVACGVIMAQQDHLKSSVSLAQVASKDTLYSRAIRSEKIDLPPAKLVIPDEAHKSRSDTWGAILNAYEGAVICGMTATPCRQDGRGLGEFYDEMIIVATYAELREGGFIVPSTLFAPVVPSMKGVKITAGDYDSNEVRKRLDTPQLVGNIVEDWKKRAADRQTVVFASGVHHSLHIKAEFVKAGIACEHLDSKNVSLAEREDILGRVHDGLVKVVTNYGILTTGWDEPAVSCMVCARSTKSFQLWRQMAGRILRSHPGKFDAVILDHSGNVFRHGYPDEDVPWELGLDGNIHEKIKKKLKADAEQQRDPFACPKCQTVYRGPACPGCGNKPSPRERAVRMVDGELKEVSREELRSKASGDDKQKKWNELLGWAVGQNRPLRAAAARYKQMYGVMPGNNLNRVPRGKQWNLPSKEYWQRLMDYEKLGMEMPEHE